MSRDSCIYRASVIGQRTSYWRWNWHVILWKCCYQWIKIQRILLHLCDDHVIFPKMECVMYMQESIAAVWVAKPYLVLVQGIHSAFGLMRPHPQNHLVGIIRLSRNFIQSVTCRKDHMIALNNVMNITYSVFFLTWDAGKTQNMPTEQNVHKISHIAASDLRSDVRQMRNKRDRQYPTNTLHLHGTYIPIMVWDNAKNVENMPLFRTRVKHEIVQDMHMIPSILILQPNSAESDFSYMQNCAFYVDVRTT